MLAAARRRGREAATSRVWFHCVVGTRSEKKAFFRDDGSSLRYKILRTWAHKWPKLESEPVKKAIWTLHVLRKKCAERATEGGGGAWGDDEDEGGGGGGGGTPYEAQVVTEERSPEETYEERADERADERWVFCPSGFHRIGTRAK